MQKYDTSKLTPLFWSEITSSYMLHDILENHHNIAEELIKKFLRIDQVEVIKIEREFPLLDAGSIDLLIKAKRQGLEIYVLVEVKIHDYASARMEQIRDYYEAALEKFDKNAVYFFYLTQFSKQNFPAGQNTIGPETIEMFENSKKNAGKYQDNYKHINWEEFHAFISNYKDKLSVEENLILELHRQWITDQCKSDIECNTVVVGERDIRDYFSDIDINIPKELDFGEHGNKQGVQTYKIDLAQCDIEKLSRIITFLRKIFTSRQIDQKASMTTKDDTLKAAINFLEGITKEPSRWGLLSFYAAFFNLIYESPFIRLYGTGASGFSLKVKIKGKREISLCTLWCRNKDILEFLEKR